MQADLNANKAIARAFFERFDANDLDGVMALFADDATFTVPGKSDEMRSAGVYDKQRIRRLFDRMTGQLPAGLRMSVSLLVAEGDIVIAEATSRGEFTDGRVYDQRYLTLFRIADGVIAEAREYNDTLHAHRIWIAPVADTPS
jgi:ketosteroid isomerase-like protein